MKNSPALDYYPQWQRLLEIAAERGATETFWLECDKIKSGVWVEFEELEQLKELMLRHGLWF